MHLQFKLVFLGKIQLKQINQRNIAKSLKNMPNSSMEHQAMCEDYRNSLEQKNAECPGVTLGKLCLCRVSAPRLSAKTQLLFFKIIFAECLLAKIFLKS
jgi:hypothetical protein